MINEKEIKALSPTEIVSFDSITAFGVFSLEQLKQIQQDARHQALTEAADITSKWMLSNQLHPNIPNEKLNESAKVAAHSVLQQAALSILTERDGEVTK